MSASNTFTDVIAGVTLTANKVNDSGDSVSINTSVDISAIKDNINEFIDDLFSLTHDHNVKEISKRVQFLAPVHTYPGEKEMEALSEGGVLVLKGTAQHRAFLHQGQDLGERCDGDLGAGAGRAGVPERVARRG